MYNSYVFYLNLLALCKEEDATVWARYSSVYFEQSAGRQACNNPHNQELENELAKRMEEKGMRHAA